MQGEIAAWSGPALDRFSFLLLGESRLEGDSVTLTRQPDSFVVGGIAQRLPLMLGQAPGLHVAVGFRIESAGTPGDGMAIVFHASADGPQALGTDGGGIGYQGLKPCFAVELDTATVDSSELRTPHVAMISDCQPSEQGAAMLSLAGDPLDGRDWILSVDWDSVSTVMDVKLTNVASSQATSIDDTVDLSNLLGSKAFVAVVAATGAFTSTHRIVSLQLRGGGVTERTLTNDVAPVP